MLFNSIKPRFVFIWILVLTLLAVVGVPYLSAVGNYSREDCPQVENGVLDLSRWDFKKEGSIELRGLWRFYWDQLLTPQDIDRIEDLNPYDLVSVPGAWNDNPVNGETLPYLGAATYTVLIKLPKELNRPLAIRIRDIYTSYRLYIDDELLAEAGVVSDQKDAYSPGFESSIVRLPEGSSDVRVTLQIANYSMPHGGPFHVPVLGYESTVSREANLSAYIEMILIGILLFSAFYYLGLFRLWPDDASAAYFGLFCLVVAFRLFITGERIGFNFFGDWLTTFRLDILTIHWIIPLFFLFEYKTWPQRLSKRLAIGLVVFSVINSIIVLVSPATVFISILPATHLVALGASVYGMYCLGVEAKKGTQGAIWTVAGLSILLLTFIHDILVTNRVVFNPYLTPVGIFSFVIAQAHMLSIRFAKAFSDAKEFGASMQREMSSRLLAEEQLRDSEREFRELADFLPIAVAEYDFDLNLTYVNRQIAQLFGYEETQSITEVDIFQQIPEEYQEFVLSEIEEARKGVLLDPIELPLIRQDGSKLWGKIYSSVIKRKGEITGIRSCIVDLTEQKSAEDKLKKSHHVLETEVEKRTYEIRKAMDAANRANQLKSEFLANVSHELRNPMHQILSYSRNGVEKIERPRHKLHHYFTQTRKAAQKLMVLLNDLLDLSKLESGKMVYDLEEGNLNKIVKEVVREYRLALEQKHLSLDYHEFDKDLMVSCDSMKITQVLRNLMTNAVDYGSGGKCIEVILKRESLNTNGQQHPGVSVAVKDFGVGIPEDEFATIFDKFTQSSYTKTGAGGTGLGLAICKEIIEAHQGRIWAYNNLPKGATFKFVLPMTGSLPED